MTVPVRSPGPDGLQAERTSLAWERTALALLVNGALLLLRYIGTARGGADLVLTAGVALAAAVVTAAVGLRRGRRLRHGVARPAAVSLVLCGVTVALLGVSVLVIGALRWTVR